VLKSSWVLVNNVNCFVRSLIILYFTLQCCWSLYQRLSSSLCWSRPWRGTSTQNLLSQALGCNSQSGSSEGKYINLYSTYYIVFSFGKFIHTLEVTIKEANIYFSGEVACFRFKNYNREVICMHKVHAIKMCIGRVGVNEKWIFEGFGNGKL
jgi:hypothetical protein